MTDKSRRKQIRDETSSYLDFSMMTASIKSIISSKTKWLHLIFLLVVTALVTAFLYFFLIPFTFWSIYGESASADRIGRLPLSMFIGEWISLIAVLIFLALRLIKNLRNHNLSNAKSYLLVAALLFILYLFREPILIAVINVFQ